MTPVEDQLPSRSPPNVGLTKKQLPWAAIAWFGILLIVAYFPILQHLVEQWYNDPDVGHGFFVPLGIRVHRLGPAREVDGPRMEAGMVGTRTDGLGLPASLSSEGSGRSCSCSEARS